MCVCVCMISTIVCALRFCLYSRSIDAMRHKPHTVWRHLQVAVTKADAIIVVPLTYTPFLTYSPSLSLSATLIRPVSVLCCYLIAMAAGLKVSPLTHTHKRITTKCQASFLSGLIHLPSFAPPPPALPVITRIWDLIFFCAVSPLRTANAHGTVRVCFCLPFLVAFVDQFVDHHQVWNFQFPSVKTANWTSGGATMPYYEHNWGGGGGGGGYCNPQMQMQRFVFAALLCLCNGFVPVFVQYKLSAWRSDLFVELSVWKKAQAVLGNV